MSRPRTRTTDPIVRARKALFSALAVQDYSGADRWVKQHPTLLQGSSLDRAHLMLQAAGSPLYGPAQDTRAWAWLETHGFEFPTEGEGFEAVLGDLLEKAPIAAVDAWRSRAPTAPIPSHLLTHALCRHNTEALTWWAKERLPWVENPPEMGSRPWILFTLLKHEFGAEAHLRILLEHGVQPMAQRPPDEPHLLLDTPLIWLARRYADRERNDTQQHQPFEPEHLDQVRRLWLMLIQAGENPATRNALGECAQTILSHTTLGPWWIAEQREQQLQRMNADRPIAARRLRV